MNASPWQWEPHPEVWIPLGLLLGGYFLAVTQWGRTATSRMVTSPKQQVLFTAGVLVLWLSVDWPMDELADHYLFAPRTWCST